MTTFISAEQDEDMYADYPYYVEFGYQGQEERSRKIEWLTRTFGDNSSWRAAIFGGGYYFKREQDLTLFRLRES